MSQPVPWPNRKEINGLLDLHQGVVYVWRTLTAKYGPPKNAWGAFCKQVIQEHSVSSNATITTGINGGINAQVNAHNKASPPNLGSKTGNVSEHSTQNVPMVIVREPDYVIQPHGQLPPEAMYPDANDWVNLQLALSEFANQRRMQEQPQPPPLPPKRNFWEETIMMMENTMQFAIQIRMCAAIIRAVFQN